ncbi:MAG TPA: efflux RND transporter periplasmic adaptor subunit [Bryobacteraceae bacterium]|nr:efflux RND transporter periplasmic adaptor subunit [Bryobacteraceae bacterium]
MKTKQKKSLAAGAALLAAGAGLWFYIGRGPAAHYQTAAVERGKVQASISATGNCNPVVTVQVGSQVSGDIKALYADFNTKVKKGQLVAEIDPQPFQARVDQAKAALDSAQTAVASAQAQIAKADSDVAAARATVANQTAAIAKAKAAANDAQIKLNTQKTLFQEGIAAKQDYDTAQSTYDQAAAEQQAAVAQLDAANHQVQSAQATYQLAKTQLGSAQAQVAQAQAALAQAQLDLDHTKIIAPVDGTVIARQMDVGQTVAASFQAPTIFQIAQDLTKMQVDTNVDEADVGQVQLGQPVRFSVDAYPSTTFRGTVTQIRQAPINVQNVITYDIVVGVSNPDLKLFPGMTANVKILTAQSGDVLRIPNAALRFRPADLQPPTSVHAAGRKQQTNESTVWVLGPDGKPKPVKVTLGITDGQFTAITGGDLKPGDEIITASLMKAASSAPAQQRSSVPRF